MINLVGYHLQQAVELSIKYTLEMNGVSYPNTHRIEDLIRISKLNCVDLHINEYRLAKKNIDKKEECLEA